MRIGEFEITSDTYQFIVRKYNGDKQVDYTYHPTFKSAVAKIGENLVKKFIDGTPAEEVLNAYEKLQKLVK